MTEEERIEQQLASQIPESVDENTDTNEIKNDETLNENPENVNPASQYLGKQLTHKIGKIPETENDDEIADKKGLSKVGESIGEKAEIREGWIPVDRELFGERSNFYPENWEFSIRPATVEAIRNWSVIDDENPNSIDDVFNEIIKSCISIRNGNQMIPWGNINSWDRFFLLLLVRDYTFVNGETQIKYDEECPGCDNPVTFELNSQNLMYEFPDEEVMYQFIQEEKSWHIDPQEYEIDAEPFILYLPTLEKEVNIKNWLISVLRENPNKKIDQVFLKFLPWMTPKISKDETIAKKQIKSAELSYKSWDMEMFTFMDEVIKNIIITPSTKLKVKCQTCGEEVTSDIRFPNSIRDLFHIKTKKKFGKKD